MKIDSSNPRWLRQEKLGWKQGLHGIMNLASGDCYTGAWKDNLKHGNGLYQSARTQHTYEGEYKYDKRDGFGILSVPKNRVRGETKIESLFEENAKFKMHTCRLVSADLGILYSGEWREDMRNGFGTEFHAEYLFEGQFKDNQRQGWGKATYKNGKVYEGEYHANKRHGQGILIESNSNEIELMNRQWR